jgi:radical SAM superfamily enzyme YgiQ (UPF0313 family)
MAKVLFTHSYFYKFDSKQWRMGQPYPPLATILAAAVIRQQGFDVSLFDTNLRDDPSELIPVLRKVAPRYVVFYDDGFNYLSKMCLTNMREAAFNMISAAKKAGCTVIVSSSDATDHVPLYLANEVDFVIRGEGEVTLKQLLYALENHEEVGLLQGIAYASGAEIITSPGRPVIRDLDSLPMPAWDLVDMTSYRSVWLRKHGYFSLNIATTRGCPFKCNWCAKPIYGNRYTSRSPQHVVDEIQWLLQFAQPDHFWICDDIFGLKPGWVAEFRNLVMQNGISIRYKIQSRVDLLLHDSAVDDLAESGAETVWVGAESGSQKILDAMDKGTTVPQIYQAAACLRKKGIKVAFFLQFGYPGENQQDIDETIKMVLDIMPDEVGISVSYPLPGTKFYDRVKDQLKDKQNWADSDDLALLFQGTYHREYYRKLHQYVHGIYRTQRGKILLKKIIHDPGRVSYKEMKSLVASIYFAVRSYALNKKLSKLKVPVLT